MEPIALIDKHIKAMEQEIAAGVASPQDPELLRLRRDLLELQRKAEELRIAIGRRWAVAWRRLTDCSDDGIVIRHHQDGLACALPKAPSPSGRPKVVHVGATANPAENHSMEAR